MRSHDFITQEHVFNKRIEAAEDRERTRTLVDGEDAFEVAAMMLMQDDLITGVNGEFKWDQ